MMRCIVFVTIISVFSFILKHGCNAYDIYGYIDEDNFEDAQDFGSNKIYDPYEKFNRSVFRFNKVFDKYVVKPPAEIYHYVVPSGIKKNINSFSSNTKEPVNIILGGLKLESKTMFDSFFRVFINSTFGILGLFDVAEEMGLKKHPLSLNSVLRDYGMKNGPYIIMPILGPSTFRDTVGDVLEVSILPVNSMNYKNKSSFRKYYAIINSIALREKYLDLDKTLSDISLDEYVALRDFYFQRSSVKTR
ncbi:MAG: phospholipid-binding lipoprotein MlaA [Candidatus Midichloriaceae bacterium]|jgi:phospholipid-binding lipoprotein MlaA